MGNTTENEKDTINLFFEQPILNSPYEYPSKHWELKDGSPTQKILNYRRPADFVTPIPKPKKYTKQTEQKLVQKNLIDLSKKEYDTAKEISDKNQKYHISLINEIRSYVTKWRNLPQKQWNVSPITARLLNHWRNYKFNKIRPFFCQIEAVETAIWLVEVAPKQKLEKQLEILSYLENLNFATFVRRIL